MNNGDHDNLAVQVTVLSKNIERALQAAYEDGYRRAEEDWNERFKKAYAIESGEQES